MCQNCTNNIKSEVVSETVGMISRFNDPALLLEVAASCVSSANDMLMNADKKHRLFKLTIKLSRHAFTQLYEALLAMIESGDFEFDEVIAFCEEALAAKEAGFLVVNDLKF